MKTECYSAIDLCKSQINGRSCDDDTIQNGAEDVVTTCAFVDLSLEPNVGDDDEIVDPGGARGVNCARRTDGSSIDGWDVTVTLCSKTDAALMELLGLFDPIVAPNGDYIGIKPSAPQCGSGGSCHCVPDEDGCPAAVSMIFWFMAWCGEARHPTLPYAVLWLPKVQFDLGTLSITRNKEFNTYTVTGTTVCPTEAEMGPADFYPEPAGLDRSWGEWLTATPPPGGCDCPCGYAPAGEALGN